MENIENRKESYVSVCKGKRRNKRKLKKKLSNLDNSSSSEHNDSSTPSSPVNVNDVFSENRDYFLPQESWIQYKSDFQIELQKQIKQRWKNDIEYADNAWEKIKKKKEEHNIRVFNSKKNFPDLDKKIKTPICMPPPPPGLPVLHSHNGLHSSHNLHGHGGSHGSHGLHVVYNERQFSQSLPELSKVHNTNFVPVVHEYNPIPSPPLFVEKQYYDHNPFVPTNDIIKQQSYYN